MLDVNLVSGQPVLRAVFFDGTNIFASFVPSLASQAGYSGTVYVGSIPQGSTRLYDPTSGWLSVTPTSFPSGANLSFVLQTWKGGGTVPPDLTATFPGVITPLSLSDAVRFSDGAIRASWVAVTDSSSNPLLGYQLLLQDLDSGAISAVGIPALSTSQGSLMLGQAVAVGSNLELRLVALNQNQAGTATPPWPLIDAAPTNVRVAVGSDAIEVWWTPSTDPSASVHLPRLYTPANGWFTYTQGTSDRPGHGSIPFDPGSAGNFVVVVIAGGTSAVAAGSTPVAVPALRPVLARVEALPDALAVSVSVNADEPLGQDVLWRALGAGGELARAASSCTPALLAVAPAAVTGIAWRSVEGRNAGLEQQLALSLVAGPAASISTNAVSAASTLEWTPIAGASGYLIDLGLGDAPVPVAATPTTHPLPAAAQASSALAARVRAQFQSSGVNITALSSPPTPALPAAPAQVDADYDGTTINAHWSAVPGSQGYVLTAYDPATGTAGATTSVDAPLLEAPLALPAGNTGQDWQLVVQSQQAGVTGLPSAPLALINSGWYCAAPTAGGPVASAALAPLADSTQVQAFADAKGSALEWLLPPLGKAALTNLPSTGSFKLDSNANSSFPYVLKIEDTSTLWSFDGSAIRSSLRADLVKFLGDLEVAGAANWGLDLVQRVLARGAPLTFQETLYVEYGLTGPASEIDQAYGSFDLRPGMILRVCTAAFVDLDPDQSGDLLNGFVGSSMVDCEITVDSSGSSWRPLLDSFAGQLLALGATSVEAPPAGGGGNTQGGVADAADFMFPTLSQNYLRVIVPDVLLSPNGAGSSQASQQFSVVGANTYASLRAITSPPAASTPYAFFGGRTLLKACVRINVNGVPQVIELGTTLADVLQANGVAPAPAAASLQGIELNRRLGPRIVDASAALEPGAAQPVFVGWRGLAPWGSASALSIPLLAGDEVWF